MLRQVARHRDANLGHTQTIDEACQFHLFAGGNGLDELPSRSFGETIDPQHIVDIESKQVGKPFHKAVVHQGRRGFSAQVLDIERFLGGEMHDTTLELRRAAEAIRT
jgi:hypothetical protein